MTQSAADCPVDLEDGLERADNDREFYRELLQMFIEDAPLRIEELAAAIASGDTASIARIAHGLKGAAANLSANALRDSAHAIETLGRRGVREGYELPLSHLRAEFRRLDGFVAGF